MRIVRVLKQSRPVYAKLLTLPDGVEKIEFFEGNPLTEKAELTGESALLDEYPLLAPVTPSKVIGIGDNFLDVGEEREPFTTPLAFLKPPSSVCGQNDKILRPENAALSPSKGSSRSS